ncbi:hypothetical protein PGQ11_003355 [Apiospora arundinis]|uniref:Uncharacterized protein n=1 Tax=Apiospora arundinis TaxID=335852 RepID=A0ABR2J594_9PEZI
MVPAHHTESRRLHMLPLDGLASRPLHPSSQIYSRRRALIDTFDCTVPSFQRTTQTLQQVHNGPYPTDLSLPLRHKSRY